MKTIVLGLVSLMAMTAVARAQVVSFPSSDLVATLNTLGEYDNAGLGTWNGAPYSPTNSPTPAQDVLSATWNFYVPQLQTNDLFIQVTNVQDTTWGFIFGAPFDLVALTGFNFSLATFNGQSLGNPTFSNSWANPGEVLDGRPNSSDPPVDVPLTSTPDWTMSQTGPLAFYLSTSTVSYAFSHFTGIYGDTRINSGGMFELVFDPDVNLLTEVDFAALTGSASNGVGAYTEAGTLAPVPLPPSGLLLVGGVIACGLIGLRSVRRVGVKRGLAAAPRVTRSNYQTRNRSRICVS